MIPIYHKTREILNSKEALLPTADGHFVSSRQALLVRGKDLVELLTSTQLQQLFGRTTWLDSDITRDVNPTIRQYLMEELEIPEIEPEEFGKKLTEEFMSKQSDEWIVKLYTFLNGQPALWRERGVIPRKVSSVLSQLLDYTTINIQYLLIVLASLSLISRIPALQ